MKKNKDDWKIFTMYAHSLTAHEQYLLQFLEKQIEQGCDMYEEYKIRQEIIRVWGISLMRCIDEGDRKLRQEGERELAV